MKPDEGERGMFFFRVQRVRFVGTIPWVSAVRPIVRHAVTQSTNRTAETFLSVDPADTWRCRDVCVCVCGDIASLGVIERVPFVLKIVLRKQDYCFATLKNTRNAPQCISLLCSRKNIISVSSSYYTSVVAVLGSCKQNAHQRPKKDFCDFCPLFCYRFFHLRPWDLSRVALGTMKIILTYKTVVLLL